MVVTIDPIEKDTSDIFRLRKKDIEEMIKGKYKLFEYKIEFWINSRKLDLESLYEHLPSIEKLKLDCF